MLKFLIAVESDLKTEESEDFDAIEVSKKDLSSLSGANVMLYYERSKNHKK